MELSAKRVLLVDDDRLMRRTLRRTLESNGCEVVEASSAAEALDALDQSFDYVLLDVHLGEDSGLQIAHAIARQPRPPRVVVITGQASREEMAALVDLGVSKFLVKTEQWDLVAVLRELADPRQPIERAARQALGHLPVLEAQTILRDKMVDEALSHSGGNKTRAAHLLGVSRQALQKPVRDD